MLLFIGVMAAGCWSELRGGGFWEVYNVLEINRGHLVCLLPVVGLFSERLIREVLLYKQLNSL